MHSQKSFEDLFLFIFVQISTIQGLSHAKLFYAMSFSYACSQFFQHSS